MHAPRPDAARVSAVFACSGQLATRSAQQLQAPLPCAALCHVGVLGVNLGKNKNSKDAAVDYSIGEAAQPLSRSGARMHACDSDSGPSMRHAACREGGRGWMRARMLAWHVAASALPLGRDDDTMTSHYPRPVLTLR